MSERVEVLARSGNSRVERIVSRGDASPPGFWYDQSELEWVMVVRGHARLRFESSEEMVEMKAGDHITIPPRARHRVEWTTPDEDTIWLAVFFAPI